MNIRFFIPGISKRCITWKNASNILPNLPQCLSWWPGCFLVLRPFLAAILLALVACVSTWPLYLWLLRRMRGRQNIAAITMTLALALLVILPLALVAYNLADNVTAFYDWIRQAIEAGPPGPPAWLKEVPIVGKSADAYWHLIATNRQELVTLQNRLLEPTKSFLLAGGILLGRGVMVMSLAAFVSFFFYRDGVALVRFLNAAMDKVVGTHVENVLGIVRNTIRECHVRAIGNRSGAGHRCHDRLRHRGRTGSVAARRTHFHIIPDPGRTTADMGQCGHLVVLSGLRGMGNLHAAMGIFPDQQRGQCGETPADQLRQQIAVHSDPVRS